MPAESYRWLGSVVENSSEIVSIIDPDGTLKYASPAWQRVLGYDAKAIIGANMLDYVNPDDLPHVLEETEKALSEAGTTTNKAEYRFRHADGSWRWMESMGTYLLDDPEVGGVVVTSREVTERKEAEEALKEAEERYRTLVERIPAVTYVDPVDDPDTSLYTSPQIAEMLGYSPEEWQTEKLWPKRIHPEDKERILAADERFEAGGEPFSEEYRLLAKNGSVVWVREDAVLVSDDKGEPLYFQGVILDITLQKEAEEALRESEERLHTLADSAFEGLVITDEGVILEVNRALIEMFGYEASDVVGRSVLEFVAPEHRVEVRQKIASGSEEPYEILGISKDGTPLALEVRGRAYRYRGHRVRVTALRDITERKKAEKRLEHRAFHDVLTDLPNRQLLLDRLGQALRRTRRRRDHRVAVLLMDLDNFKRVNDSLGHEVGDLLLMLVTERLKRCLRPEDTLGRLGGDEFVVLLEDANGLDEAVRVKERIAEGFKRPFVLAGRELYVAASIGIALGDVHAESPEDILRNADTAMYEAKSEAAFGHRVFDPAMHERVLRRLSLENDLRRAIEQEEFRLFYQPKIQLKEEDSIAEVEALLRWEHPHRGLLLPDEFITLAEESGLIIPLGRWVLKEACRQVKEWQESYPILPPLVTCVNVSAGQLLYPDLLHDVGTALGESDIEARSLVLEITESALVKDMPTSITTVKGLRDLGVRFAVDDFGSEYSSLSYLMRLPVDFVKIDKSFVWGLGVDPKATVIVEAIISLAHSLGLEVVGEGVENTEHLMHLRRMGCDLAQGKYLSEPVPSEEIDRLLARQGVY
jgi:diguanylate cyclase (GGDEF)-like protein/PAS domain S-box-containing protein